MRKVFARAHMRTRRFFDVLVACFHVESRSVILLNGSLPSPRLLWRLRGHNSLCFSFMPNRFFFSFKLQFAFCRIVGTDSGIFMVKLVCMLFDIARAHVRTRISTQWIHQLKYLLYQHYYRRFAFQSAPIRFSHDIALSYQHYYHLFDPS